MYVRSVLSVTWRSAGAPSTDYWKGRPKLVTAFPENAWFDAVTYCILRGPNDSERNLRADVPDTVEARVHKPRCTLVRVE